MDAHFRVPWAIAAGRRSPCGGDLLKRLVAQKLNPVQYGGLVRSPPGTDDADSTRSGCGREGVA